jgi:hypothetical protein
LSHDVTGRDFTEEIARGDRARRLFE